MRDLSRRVHGLQRHRARPQRSERDGRSVEGRPPRQYPGNAFLVQWRKRIDQNGMSDGPSAVFRPISRSIDILRSVGRSTSCGNASVRNLCTGTPCRSLCEYSAPDTHIGRTLASDYIQIMTIVQVSWCDSERDIRCNHPSAFDGIPERFSAPMAEYVFLDSIEHAQELRTRITRHVPIERQPYMQTLLTCADAVIARVGGTGTYSSLPSRLEFSFRGARRSRESKSSKP